MATVVFDAFTDSDSTSLDAHTPDTAPEGSGWTEAVGNWIITGNKAALSAAQNQSVAHIDSGEADCTITVKATSNAGTTSQARDAGVIARLTDTNNYWRIGINASANAFRIVERNTGGENVRATTSVTINAGQEYTLVVTLSGQSITATIDGGNEISYGSAALNETATEHGICARETSDRLDDYTVEIAGGGGNTYQMSATIAGASATSDSAILSMAGASVFDHFPGSSLDSRWASAVSGSGSVTVSDSNATINPGGSANDDAAILYLNEKLNMGVSQDIVITAKWDGGEITGLRNALFLVNKATAPVCETDATWEARKLVGFEWQLSASPNNRIMAIYYDTGGTRTYWRQANLDWSTSFAYSWQPVETGGYVVFVIRIDADNNRVMLCGYGKSDTTDVAAQGMWLHMATEWVSLSSIRAQSDGVWIVLGDPATDESRPDSMSVEFVSIARDFATYGYTNLSTSGTSPLPYNIHAWSCRDPENLPLYLPIARENLIKARGGTDYEAWLKDPVVVYDGAGTYHWFFNGRSTAGVMRIFYGTSSDPETAPAGTLTVIMDPPTSHDNAAFPYPIYDPDADAGKKWTLFFDAEASGTFRIFYSQTDTPGTKASWSTPTQLLGESGTGYRKHGVAQATIVLVGSTYQMWHAGYNADDGASGQWRTNVATATSLTGTYSNLSETPVLDVGAALTTTSASADGRTLTVNDSSNFAAEQPVLLADDHPAVVRDVPSGTSIELYQHVVFASGINVARVDHYSVAVRSLHKVGSTWILYATAFRWPGGEESTVAFTNTNTDPTGGTWVIAPWQPAPMTYEGTYPTFSFSNENIGLVLTELTAESGGGGNTYQMSASIAGASSTPDDASLAVTRNVSISVSGASATPDTASLAITRNATAVITSASITPDDITLAVTRSANAVIAGTSATSTDAILAVTRQVAANIAGQSVTPDDVSMSVLRQVAAAINGVSVTSDVATLAILRQTVATITGVSITPDNVILSIAGVISAAASITGVSATSDNASLAVTRSATASIAGSSATPDDATLTRILQAIASIAGISNTSDDAALAVTRNALAQIAGQSATSDAASLAVLRQVAASIAGSSATPDDVNLVLSVIAGMIQVSYTTKAPGASVTAKAPGITFSVGEE